MKRKHLALVLASACGLLLGGCSFEDVKNASKNAWDSTSNFFVDTWNKVTGKEVEEPKKEEEHHEEEHHEEEHHEEEHHEEETPKVEITVSELPEYLEIGSTLDLAEFVSVTGADDYSIVLDEESKALASLEGKVITALAEGEIKFEVVAGEEKTSKSVMCVFGDRAKFVELAGNAGKNYTVYELDEEYEVYDMYAHTDNYVLELHFTVNDEQTMWVPGGYLTFTGEDCYEYIVTSSDGEYYDTVEANPIPADPEYLYLFNSEFSVDFSTAEYMYDEELECGSLVVRDQEAMLFAENSLMLEDGYAAYYTDESHTDWNFFIPSYVEFVYDEAVEDEPAYLEAYLYTDVLSRNQEPLEEDALFSVYVIYFNEDEIGWECIDEFVADENNIPEFPNYAETYGITAMFDYMFEEKVGTEFMASGNWYNYAATTAEEFYIDQPADAAGSWFENATNSLEAIYYDESGIVSLGGNGAPTAAKILHGEPAVVYDVEVSEDGYVAYANTTISSPWEAEEYDYSFLGSEGVLDYALNPIGVDENNCLHLEILEENVPNVFISLALLTNELIPLTSDLYTAYYGYGNNLFKYFDTDFSLNLSTYDVDITFDLLWDADIHYVVEFSFSFGADLSGAVQYVESLAFPIE